MTSYDTRWRLPGGEQPTKLSARDALSQTMAMAWRGLLRLRHHPRRMVDVVLLPIVGVALLASVFGGAIAGGVRDYLPDLIPGLMAQISVTAAIVTGLRLRDDHDQGVFDRFRSLPIARIAPLAGALLSEVVRYLTAGTLTLVVGVVVGFRPESVLGAVLAVLLVTVCAFALSWAFAYLGACLRNPPAVHSFSALIAIPLALVSNLLVPIDTMPGWLRPIATVNPVTPVVSAARDLTAAQPAGHAVLLCLLGALVVVGVFAPLTMRAQFRQE